MSSCEWQEHDGKPYLRMTYGPDPSLSLDVQRRALELITALPEGTTVRTLVDVSRASMTGWPREGMSEGRRSISELTRRTRCGSRSSGSADRSPP